MMWLTWRQHRAQVLGTVGLVLLVGMVMLALGRDAAAYLSWLPVVPLLAGIFWGAPLLARELETGTHRLAWTQSVPRSRWLLAKVGWLGLAVTVTGLTLGLMTTAWLAASGGDRFANSTYFGATGVAVGAWWLFSFLLGASAGGVVRRLLPAMVVTVAVFLVALFGIFQTRGDYAQPMRWTSDSALEGHVFVSGAGWLSPSGAEVDEPPVCADASDRTYLTCVQDAGYRSVMYYHPADRYWRFQWTETGILLLGAVLLAGPVVYRVLRRPV
jgi:hypothetical protein